MALTTRTDPLNEILLPASDRAQKIVAGAHSKWGEQEQAWIELEQRSAEPRTP